MLFIIRLNLSLLIFIFISHQCFASTPPRGSKNEANRVLAAGVRSLNFDSDDEDDMSQHGSVRSPPRTQIRGPFNDDEDEGHGASSSGTNSAASARSSAYRQPKKLILGEFDSDDESSIDPRQMSATSGVFYY